MLHDEKQHNPDQEQNTTADEANQAPESQDLQINDPFKDQYLRLNADFQNFKRRVEKERAEWMSSAQSGILKKILPVFDELDQVIVLAKGQETADTAWTQGLALSQKNWQKMLADLGVEEISTSGMFDPELHEGLMQEEVADKQSGEIVKTFSKGYRFKGAVIKHAKVSVAK